jgi:hypothetical protein
VKSRKYGAATVKMEEKKEMERRRKEREREAKELSESSDG